jgi:hypothetical protein
MAFRSIPRIRVVGIEWSSELGVTDPVIIFGWEDAVLLNREMTLLARHLPSIDFAVEWKPASSIHSAYCYHPLIRTAPKTSTPVVMIG